MSAPRVLFATHAYPRFAGDAAGVFLHRLALALHERGASVQVLAPSGPGLAPEETLDGIPIQRFRYAPSGMESLAYTGTMAEQVLGSLRGKGALAGMLTAGTMALRRAAERTGAELVHAHWWFPAGLLALGAPDALPLLTTMHGSDVRLARGTPLVHPLFRRVMARSRVATAVSSWLAGEARAMAPDANIRVAPMPVDVEEFPFSPDTRPEGALLFVGRLNAQKGVDDLLQALAWTSAKVSVDVVGDGEDANALRARAAALGVQGRVRWLGALPHDELPARYRAARAVVIPSRDEGLGLVAVEAQLSGTPVLAYRSGGLVDVVDPSQGGTVVPAGDVRALADAMDRLALGDPVDMTAARETMLARFAPAAVAEGYLALYAEACA